MASSTMKRLLSMCFVLVGFSSLLLAQPQTNISGRVTDAATNAPLPFASVYLNGSTRGTTTDEQGRYTLSHVPLGTVEVVASFLGYKPTQQTLRLTEGSLKAVSFSLKADENLLHAVTVKAGRDKRWERQRRQFEQYLLGKPFGDQCQLVNSHVLNFKTKDDRLLATATEPLVIVNNALGYTLSYELQFFDGSAQRVYYGGTSRFTPLPAKDPKQAARVHKNRMRAYLGSTRHLLASLVRGQHEAEEFAVYYEDPSRPMSTPNEPPLLSEAISRFKRLTPIVADSLIRPAQLAAERRLVSKSPLVIFYTRASSPYSPYRDARYSYSQLRLPLGTMLITTDGQISQPNGMEMKGSLADDRLSTLLPSDWQPTPAPGALSAHLAHQAGPFRPTDAVMTPIRKTFTQLYTPLAPSVFVHIAKPFYATGDWLWLTAYLLDAPTNRLVPGETALHIDLLGPTGHLVHHQYVRVRQGRAWGEFPLSDTLRTGTYRLRAYTDEDQTLSGPAFEREVLIYNPADRVSGGERAAIDRPDRGPDSPVRLEVDADSTALMLAIDPLPASTTEAIYWLIGQRGRILGEYKTRPQGRKANLVVPMASLGDGGLVQVLVYDAEARLLAQRLAFVPDRQPPVRVTVQADKDQYKPRERVELTLSLTDGNGQPVEADLSVSVTDAGQLLADSTAPTIQTHLLLTGQIQNPLSATTAYRSDKGGNSTSSINGWLQTARWRWPDKAPDDSLRVGGLSIGGQVQTADGKPRPDVYVTLASFDPKGPFTRFAQANGQGRFRLMGLSFTDTLSGLVQLGDATGKPIAPGDVRLLLDHPGSNWRVDSTTTPFNWLALQEQLRAARARLADGRGLPGDKTGRQLAEVTVRGRVVNEADEAVRRLSLHSGADEVIKFDDKGIRYANLYEMLRGKAAGVLVVPSAGGDSTGAMGGYKVIVRGYGSLGGIQNPLYLLDGMPVVGDPATALLGIPPESIERIEILKNGGSAGIYGVRAGGGVIAFYTRRGFLEGTSKKLTIPLQLIGYPSVRREFPVWPHDESPSATSFVDRRDVLYWKPQLQTDPRGQLKLAFPLSDIVRQIRVTAQGITPGGHPVTISTLIRVQ